MNLLNKTGLLATLVGAFLVGCGGGSGGAAAPDALAPSVSGVAATGAAIAAGSVTLKCSSGITSAVTTGTDGSFTIDVGALTLPCVGRVDFKNAAGVAQKLHTFISAAGTANITPITELLVANLTGGTAADAFDKFDAAKTKAFTAAQIKTAATAVKTYLTTLGVATANLPDDPVGTKFVAKAGAVSGDAFDKVLDDLQAKLLLAGKTLALAVADVSAPPAGTASGGGSSADGPTVNKAKLTLLCPNQASPIAFTQCKASQDASVNAVMIDINVWMQANAANFKVTMADAGMGVAVGDSCSFNLEPGLGLWMVSFKGGTVFPDPAIGFTGVDADAVELTAGGQIGYLSAGDSFSSAKGKMEINFPGFTKGSPVELVYAKSGKIVICKPAK